MRHLRAIDQGAIYLCTPGGKFGSVTYPSGRVVTNTRNGLRKISAVSATGFGDLVSNLSYRPFGGPKGLTNGFGGTVNNQAGECDCVTISNPGQPRERTYGYDSNRNLTSITGTNTPWYNQTFGYDELNRLATATGRYGTISYTYDDVGNRVIRNTNGVVENYTYYTGTNSLYQITGGQDPRTFTYDANGNPTSDGTLTFTYDPQNQLKEVKEGANTIATYTYNGLGQRVKKVAGGVTTVYHYDLDGKLIAESELDGDMTKEYLYMGKVRVAMVDIGPGGSSIYHYLNDRLGTPEILTDASGTVRWEAWYEPFGEAHIHPSSSVVNNIRLPGQYYDQETGLHYNYHRYYDPRTGRYMTPDPVGLRGGINLYTYVTNNPIGGTDPFGLRPLSPVEKSALKFYFGPSLNLEVINLDVSTYDFPWSPAENEIQLPSSYFKNSNPCEDVDLSRSGIYGLFAHEATHVWQRQQGRSVSWPAFIGYVKQLLTSGEYNPYHYRKSSDPNVMLNTFLRGDVDQQGQIVEDFVQAHQATGYAPAYHEIWAHLLTVEKGKGVSYGPAYPRIEP